MSIAASPTIDVPKVVTDDQVRFFVENGYLVVPDLMTDDEIMELRQETVDLARGKYECETLKPLPETMSDDEAIRNILCIHQPHYISPVSEKYVKHPKICGALSQITAAHLPHWDGSVKCMQSMLFVKPPQFQGQAWHQDEIYIPTRDRSLIGAWIAMDDATIENGCLYVIPGSHRMGYLYPQKGHENPDEFDFAPESFGFDESAEVPVEVKAGALVFFNGYLLHRSRKNRSGVYRRGATTATHGRCCLGASKRVKPLRRRIAVASSPSPGSIRMRGKATTRNRTTSGCGRARRISSQRRSERRDRRRAGSIFLLPLKPESHTRIGSAFPNRLRLIPRMVGTPHEDARFDVG